MPIDTQRLRERRAKLEAELEELRAQEQAAEERRCLIVGRAVLDHAVRDETFRAELMALLDRQLSKKRDRQLFGLAIGRTRPGGAGS